MPYHTAGLYGSSIQRLSVAHTFMINMIETSERCKGLSTMEYNCKGMTTQQIQTVLSLLETEEILQRHLNETRAEIKAACYDVALHTPGVHRSPDMIIEIYGGVL